MPIAKQDQKESVGQDFEKMDKLGEGAFGVVYRAKHRATGLIVALKKIRLKSDEEGVPSIAMREVSTLKELSGHPCIVRMLDVIMDQKGMCLVFEYMDMDLKKYMETKFPGDELMDLQAVKSYSYQILHALCFCHMRRIIHRDLKPQNLLLNKRGVIKLADFGLARTYGIPVRVYTHEVVTLWYRAPEVLLGTEKYACAIDVWSVGTILAEMINKKPLFCGDSEIDQLFKIFRKLGTPKENVWPGVSHLAFFKETFPNWEGTSFASMLVQNDENAAHLLGSLLTYNPAVRMTAKIALHHPFFEDLPRTKPLLSKLEPWPKSESSDKKVSTAGNRKRLCEISNQNQQDGKL